MKVSVAQGICFRFAESEPEVISNPLQIATSSGIHAVI